MDDPRTLEAAFRSLAEKGATRAAALDRVADENANVLPDVLVSRIEELYHLQNLLARGAEWMADAIRVHFQLDAADAAAELTKPAPRSALHPQAQPNPNEPPAWAAEVLSRMRQIEHAAAQQHEAQPAPPAEAAPPPEAAATQPPAK